MKSTVLILGYYTGLDELRSRRPRGEVDRLAPDLAEGRATDAGVAGRELKDAEKRTAQRAGLVVPSGVGTQDDVVVAGQCSMVVDVADGMEAGPVVDDVDDAVRTSPSQ